MPLHRRAPEQSRNENETEGPLIAVAFLFGSIVGSGLLTGNALTASGWPVILVLGAFALGHRDWSWSGNAPGRGRMLGSALAFLLAASWVAHYWARIVPAYIEKGFDGPSAVMKWAALCGALTSCAMLVIAALRSDRRLLCLADAIAILWLFGPAVPWMGETP